MPLVIKSRRALTFNLGIENFIEDALYKPNDYIGYHVGRRLAELHPEKSVVAGQTWYFDLENFVTDGHFPIH